MFVIALGCALVFGYALYLQYGVGLVPCPMCIVQRYAFTGVAVAALFAGFSPGLLGRFAAVLSGLFALFGAFTAARQSWIQRFPSEDVSCGRDFYGMVEQLPINRYLPLIFKGSGDCSAIDWTLMGLTVANYSLLAFIGVVFLIAVSLLRKDRRGQLGYPQS